VPYDVNLDTESPMGYDNHQTAKPNNMTNFCPLQILRTLSNQSNCWVLDVLQRKHAIIALLDV
jgi:hypothetical protein